MPSNPSEFASAEWAVGGLVFDECLVAAAADVVAVSACDFYHFPHFVCGQADGALGGLLCRCLLLAAVLTYQAPFDQCDGAVFVQALETAVALLESLLEFLVSVRVHLQQEVVFP